MYLPKFSLMKRLLLCVVILTSHRPAAAQERIDGLWYSADSTRIYRVFAGDTGYEAILHESRRKNDAPGVLILSNITCTKPGIVYKGLIHAADDGMAVHVKIKYAEGGKKLILKLRRMFIFPLHLEWRRAE
jgi:hypothetical protein